MITIKEYRQLKKPKTNKYRNVKINYDGILFDSKKEANHYKILLTMQQAGIINNLKSQVPFEIIVEGKNICKYIADFTYFDSKNNFIVEDVKSEITKSNAVYKLKKKLMLAVHKIIIKEI